MSTSVHGRVRTWEGKRNSEGHREFKVKHLIKADFGDGPYNVMQTPGLPAPGSTWAFGDDADIWATCKQDMDVSILQEKEGDLNRWWAVEQVFSTKADEKSCKDQQIENPLLEPQKVSGSFVKDREEATHDRFGNRIVNTAFEPVRGPQNEWDKSNLQVVIEQNVAVLGLPLLSAMRDTLNVATLWGLPPRTIKLSNISWERKFYGLCFVYYTRKFEFDINIKINPDTSALESGWDRDLLDEGTKVLRGDWETNPNSADYPFYVAADDLEPVADPASNPANFKRFQDFHGNTARVIFSKNFPGYPYDPVLDPTDAPRNIHVEKYGESNFLLLGIPTTF
jgi:hypothetical protein